jgi:hypothetical protein
LLARLEEVLLPEVVGVVGNEFGRRQRGIKSNAEHMVLVNTLADLTLPDPTTAKFIAIAAFIQEHVARHQLQAANFVFSGLDQFNVFEVQVSSLDIGYAEVRNGSGLGSGPPLLAFGQAAYDLAEVPSVVKTQPSGRSFTEPAPR